MHNLWKESNMHVRPKSALERSSIVLQDERTVTLSGCKGSLHLSGQQHYSSGPIASCSEHYWIFKSKYSAEQAQTWGLKCCEEEFCKVTDLQDNATLHFTCTLYPETQACGAYDKTAWCCLYLRRLSTESKGGSSFSPAAAMSKKRAKELGASLASEVSCSSAVPEELLACLRDVPALQLNAAQTKLLAVRGPFQAWGPVVDGVSVQEHPTSALQSSRFHKVDLMVGTSAEDGLISRAKHIKKFEELQGRTNSKTAFYEALTNSLGGENGNSFVQAAAAWFYSMQHSPSPSGYNVFSRALENATRDHFIICPSVKMASFWADNTRSSVFMYHVPEQVSQTSIDLSVPFDIQLVFGLPHHPKTEQLFTAKERSLSLKTMHYVVNFIKSGNPNHPYTFSTKSFSETLPPWPRFLPHPTGDNYKEFDVSLQNRKGLRKAECSFWSDYIPTLKASTGNIAGAGLQLSEDGDEVLTSPTEQSKLFDLFLTSVTQSKPKSEKDAYN